MHECAELSMVWTAATWQQEQLSIISVPLLLGACSRSEWDVTIEFLFP
jgi:hypothetical protein